MRIVSIKNLKPDMTLAQPVYKNGVILLNSGTKSLAQYRKRLLEMGIQYVYVFDRHSEDVVINNMVREEIKRRGEKSIKSAFEAVNLGKTVNYGQVKSVVSDLMGEILESDRALVNLFSIKDYDSYTYSHSINVAVISMLIGKSLNLNYNKVLKIGEGAIMHDIGKVLVPREIISKAAGLTDAEFGVIKQHSRLGYNFLKQKDSMSPLSRIVVLSHHERADGSGYPRGLRGRDIHLFARITAIADVFDALTSDRPYRKRWTISKTLDYMTAQADSKFDYSLMNTFARKIAVYPNGIMVLLNNGVKAIIKEQNSGYPTRPIIKIIVDERGNPLSSPVTVDLLKELDLQVIDTI